MKFPSLFELQKNNLHHTCKMSQLEHSRRIWAKILTCIFNSLTNGCKIRGSLRYQFRSFCEDTTTEIRRLKTRKEFISKRERSFILSNIHLGIRESSRNYETAETRKYDKTDIEQVLDAHRSTLDTDK